MRASVSPLDHDQSYAPWTAPGAFSAPGPSTKGGMSALPFGNPIDQVGLLMPPGPPKLGPEDFPLHLERTMDQGLVSPALA